MLEKGGWLSHSVCPADCHSTAVTHFSPFSDYNLISKFLNRILGLPVEQQNALFQYFTDTLAACILHAKKDGKWDLGILGQFSYPSAGLSPSKSLPVSFLLLHLSLASLLSVNTNFSCWVFSDLGAGGENVKVNQRKAFTHEYGGSITKTELVNVSVERGLSWEDAMDIWRGHIGSNDGFYLSNTVSNITQPQKSMGDDNS